MSFTVWIRAVTQRTSPPITARLDIVVTVPDTVDTDGDKLSDTADVDTFGTDPNRTDTDRDGYPDGMEMRYTRSLPGADQLRTDI